MVTILTEPRSEQAMRPYTRIEVITPKKAAEWLKRNTHNRDLQARRVKRLAGAIQRNEWNLTGDCIVFSGDGDDGVLLNGQHRLYAIIDADIPAQVVVLYNVAPVSQEVMDSGLPRSLGAKLKLRGESYYNELSSGLRSAWSYDSGYSIGGRGGNRPGGQATDQQLLSYLDINPEIRDATGPAKQLRREFLSPAGPWTSIVFLFRRAVGRDLADEFFDRLLSGADLPTSSPVYRLRRLFAKQRSAPPGRRFGQEIMAAVTVKAFNAFCLGQEPALLKFDQVREEFPRLVGKDDLL